MCQCIESQYNPNVHLNHLERKSENALKSQLTFTTLKKLESFHKLDFHYSDQKSIDFWIKSIRCKFISQNEIQFTYLKKSPNCSSTKTGNIDQSQFQIVRILFKNRPILTIKVTLDSLNNKLIKLIRIKN